MTRELGTLVDAGCQSQPSCAHMGFRNSRTQPAVALSAFHFMHGVQLPSQQLVLWNVVDYLKETHTLHLITCVNDGDRRQLTNHDV